MIVRRFLWSALRIVAVNTGLLVVLAVAVDLVLGDWLSSDGLGPVRVPRNVEVRRDVRGLYGREAPIVYRRDANGLRGAYADAGRIDILTIGGSTTDQRYLDDDDTWQAALERNFAAAGMPVVIVNAGVDGHSTIGHLASFARWFPRIRGLKARFVLFYVGINDVFTDFHAWSDRVVNESWRGRLVQIYRNNSVYYRTWRDLKGWLAAREAGLEHRGVDFARLPWTDRPLRAGHAERYAERLTAYEGRLGRLMEAVRAFGARPILVTQPRGDARFQDGRWLGAVDGLSSDWRLWREDNGLDRHIVQSLFNAVTLKVCRATAGAICVVLAEEARFDIGDFYDNVHASPQGTRKIGAFLFEALRAPLAGGAGS